MPRDLPSPELLRKLLRYEPETGKLFWRKRGLEMFKYAARSADWKMNAWNSRNAGKEAFLQKVHGYRRGTLLGKMWSAHRIAWAIYYGAWPLDQIDHINGVRDDNRIVNLRGASNALNSRNIKLPANNTSGVIGVAWDKSRRKWSSRIKVDGRNISLGRFNCITAATVVRKSAEKRFGFHENHGRAQ